jgi:hypothetical protein
VDFETPTPKTDAEMAEIIKGSRILLNMAAA